MRKILKKLITGAKYLGAMLLLTGGISFPIYLIYTQQSPTNKIPLIWAWIVSCGGLLISSGFFAYFNRRHLKRIEDKCEALNDGENALHQLTKELEYIQSDLSGLQHDFHKLRKTSGSKQDILRPGYIEPTIRSRD